MKRGADNKNTRTRVAMRVSVNTIIGNTALSALKLTAGIVASSGAMVSDAVNSISDVFSTIIVMIGMRMAGKASDERHQYGHERFESVAAILLAAIVCATGLLIGYAGVRVIMDGNYSGLSVPGLLALIAAIVSIVVKEGMYWYTRAAAKRISSSALMASAWDHRSDALSSVGGLIGIAGARMGLPVLDPIASVVICLFILKAAFDIFMDAVGKMTDSACDDDTVAAISTVIKRQDGVLGIDKLRTRLFGDRMYVDVEIRADGQHTLTQAHDTAERVHDAIERAFPKVKHCMVHVNPDE